LIARTGKGQVVISLNFDWVCAAHLECISLVLKNARITGKNQCW